VVARYGGEEFAVVLGDTAREAARGVAERLRAEVERTEFPNERVLPGGQLTISVGLAAYPEDAADRTGLIAKADAALYAAKRAGRNRVCWRPDECRAVERVNLADLQVFWRPVGPAELPLRPARLEDFSPKGAALAIDESLPDGAAIRVTLTGDVLGRSLEVPARVLWCQEVPGGARLVGLSFAPDRPEVQAGLDRLVSARSRLAGD
jgi:hypothetical protein